MQLSNGGKLQATLCPQPQSGRGRISLNRKSKFDDVQRSKIDYRTAEMGLQESNEAFSVSTRHRGLTMLDS